jgi:ubiquitin-like protein Pup
VKHIKKQKTANVKDRQDVQGAEEPVDTQQGPKDDLDTLLDEVEAVLEKNAEEFVSQYIQKGGQ